MKGNHGFRPTMGSFFTTMRDPDRDRGIHQVANLPSVRVVRPRSDRSRQAERRITFFCG